MKTFLLYLFVTMVLAGHLSAQTTEFSYQGNLKDGAAAANGSYDFEFRLFDSLSGGAQIGPVASRTSVAVVNGIFSVSLNFGAGTLPGADRFLEIRVRASGELGHNVLEPRQKIGSSPYAIKSLIAENALAATTAGNSLQLGGVSAAQFVQTGDSRLSDARPPIAGSTNYIQNQNAGPQAVSSFNITGDGTVGSTFRANIVSAVSQYNLNNNRIIGAPGANNLILGLFSGQALTSGLSNTFIGHNAGQNTTTGGVNVFVGASAGGSNTSGASNTFVGLTAGSFNTIGSENSFFGKSAGFNNTTGINNTFLGFEVGRANTNGENNTFVGHNTGSATTTGDNNVFVGKGAGTANVGGSSNTLVGYNAEVGTANLTFAGAIGAGAVVDTDNTLVLGRSSDIVRVPGFIRVLQLGGAGSTQLCLNGNFTISTCSSSLRYKTNINRFGFGLDLINKLMPISFDWKDGGMRDLGLGAEDVAAIEPLLVNYNKKGEVEGVKYDRIGVVLVNAVKEQQTQIERQKAQIDALTKYICERDRTAAFCTP